MSIPPAHRTSSYQELGSKSPELDQSKAASANWFAQLTTQVCKNLEHAHPARGGWERADIPDGVHLFKKSWKEQWPLPEQSSPAFYVSLWADRVANELICNVVLEDDLILRHRVQISYDIAKVFFDGPEVMVAKVPLSQKGDMEELSTKSVDNLIIEEAVQNSVALNQLDSVD